VTVNSDRMAGRTKAEDQLNDYKKSRTVSLLDSVCLYISFRGRPILQDVYNLRNCVMRNA